MAEQGVQLFVVLYLFLLLGLTDADQPSRSPSVPLCGGKSCAGWSSREKRAMWILDLVNISAARPRADFARWAASDAGLVRNQIRNRKNLGYLADRFCGVRLGAVYTVRFSLCSTLSWSTRWRSSADVPDRPLTGQQTGRSGGMTMHTWANGRFTGQQREERTEKLVVRHVPSAAGAPRPQRPHCLPPVCGPGLCHRRVGRYP